MYHHVDYRWLKTFLTKLLSVFLIYSIFFTTSANASVGGWSMGNPVAVGASTVYTGTKQLVINGADYIKKGTAKITPPASGVAKVLARGVAGYALSVAVEQLLGSVDWVLDPANNQIKYKDPNSSPDNCTVNSKDCEYSKKLYYADATSTARYSTPEQACHGFGLGQATKDFIYKSFKVSGTTCIAIYTNKATNSDFDKRNGIVSVANPSYNPASEKPDDKEKSIPLETVAQKVISNAESGDTNSQVATTAAAADIVAEAETDQTGVKARPIVNQLENSSTTKPADEAAADKANEATGEQTKNPDKPDTTDLKLTFPIFCNWAPTVCEAAQTVISFPKTLTNWWETGKEKAEGWAASISESWTETKEWVKDDTKLDDTDNDPPVVKDIPIGTLDTSAFKGTAGCPSPIQVPVTFAKSGNVEISYEPICAMASKWSFVAPFIGFFSGALIILGVGRKGEDSDT